MTTKKEYIHESNRLVNETADYLRSNGINQVDAAIILGTGLGMLASRIDAALEFPYDEIPHFPASTVESHAGKLMYGSLSGKKVIALQGRFHAYEGYSQAEITFPVRVLKALGAKYLLISNAAGAVNLNFRKGELMLVSDHINLLGGSPLTGFTDKRFVDLAMPYHDTLQHAFRQNAAQHGITLHEGVYACVHGPHLETRAEYRYIRMIGADAVGMSTVPEVIVANHVGLPCAAISVITDTCDPDNLEPISIPDILAAAGAAEPRLCTLVEACLSTVDISI